MKTIAFLLFLGSACYIHATSQADDNLRRLLFLLSSESINYSTSLSEDSIISLCNAVKTKALAGQDYATFF